MKANYNARAPLFSHKDPIHNSGYNQVMDFSLIIPLILGWLSGWLVNYLADLLPATHKLGRPVCPACQTPFKWTETLLFRNCSNCGKRRSLRTFDCPSRYDRDAGHDLDFPEPNRYPCRWHLFCWFTWRLSW